MKKIIVPFVLLLFGCAGQPLSQSAIDEINRPVTCIDKADCDAKWSRTQIWIVNNTIWKIKTATDTIIQTEGPFQETSLAFTALRQVKADSSGEITIRAYCGNWVGCVPSPVSAILNFKYSMD